MKFYEIFPIRNVINKHSNAQTVLSYLDIWTVTEQVLDITVKLVNTTLVKVTT